MRDMVLLAHCPEHSFLVDISDITGTEEPRVIASMSHLRIQ